MVQASDPSGEALGEVEAVAQAESRAEGSRLHGCGQWACRGSDGGGESGPGSARHGRWPRLRGETKAKAAGDKPRPETLREDDDRGRP